jgi:hypothetical protein
MSNPRDEVELIIGYAVRMASNRRDPLCQGEADYENDRRTLEGRRKLLTVPRP